MGDGETVWPRSGRSRWLSRLETGRLARAEGRAPHRAAGCGRASEAVTNAEDRKMETRGRGGRVFPGCGAVLRRVSPRAGVGERGPPRRRGLCPGTAPLHSSVASRSRRGARDPRIQQPTAGLECRARQGGRPWPWGSADPQGRQGGPVAEWGTAGGTAHPPPRDVLTVHVALAGEALGTKQGQAVRGQLSPLSSQPLNPARVGPSLPGGFGGAAVLGPSLASGGPGPVKAQPEGRHGAVSQLMASPGPPWGSGPHGARPRSAVAPGAARSNSSGDLGSFPRGNRASRDPGRGTSGLGARVGKTGE